MPLKHGRLARSTARPQTASIEPWPMSPPAATHRHLPGRPWPPSRLPVHCRTSDIVHGVALHASLRGRRTEPSTRSHPPPVTCLHAAVRPHAPQSLPCLLQRATGPRPRSPGSRLVSRRLAKHFFFSSHHSSLSRLSPPGRCLGSGTSGPGPGLIHRRQRRRQRRRRQWPRPQRLLACGSRLQTEATHRVARCGWLLAAFTVLGGACSHFVPAAPQRRVSSPSAV